MASIYKQTATTKLDWAQPFQRTNAWPLDRSEMFNSLEDAKKYAMGLTDDRELSGAAYAGQEIAVVNFTPGQSGQPDVITSVVRYIVTGGTTADTCLAQVAIGDWEEYTAPEVE